MSTQETWIDRRQRAVKCKIHGLHFDPKLQSGCPRCRKEQSKREVRKRPQLVIMLLALLGVALSAYQVFGPGAAAPQNTLERSAGPAVVTAAAPSRLDPEKYRPSLQSFEAALFTPRSSALEAIADHVSAAGLGLSGTLRDDNHTDPAVAIDRLVKSIDSASFTAEQLNGLRRSWLAERQRFFRSAPWMRTSVPSGVGRAEIATYREILDQMESELDLAYREAQRIAADLSRPPVPGVDPQTERARLAEIWRETASSWEEQIFEIEKRLPKRPSASAGTNILLAAQRIEQVIAKTRRLARSGNLPLSSSYETQLDDAQATIDEARRAVDALLSS